MDETDEIVVLVRYCLLPKLSRNVDEIDNHPEYYDWQNKLDTYFPPVLHFVANMNFENADRLSQSILPSLLILYLQRSWPTAWNTPKCKCYVQQLNTIFSDKSGITLERVLQSCDFCNTQDVFDNILLELSSKLVSDDYKRYPGLIDVYCALMNDIKEFKIKINPVKIFPICLLLLDDYQNANKIKGLKCFYSILQCLNEKHFKSGNYYEVLLGSLKKTMSVKELEITIMVMRCLLDLIKIVPTEVKNSKTDELFGTMLEQIHLESNLYRKTACVRYLIETMYLHKVDCVRKKLLKVVLLENIQICCNAAVADILLGDVITCLQAWIINCWCTWQLSSDHKILSALIKLLYVSRKESIASVIQDIIVSLVTLCTKDEQKTIYKSFEKSEIKSPEFKEKLEEINLEIKKLCE